MWAVAGLPQRPGRDAAGLALKAAQDEYELEGLESDRRSTMVTYLVVLV